VGNSKQYNADYYLKNKEVIAEKRKEKRATKEFKEKIKAYQANYHKNNPHKSRENRRRRRVSLLGLPTEKYTEQEVLELYGCSCHICGEEIDLEAPRMQGKEGWEKGLHMDHLIPISKGGSDMLDNVRPAHAYCNLSKGSRFN
jgi:5-methylcytosine-specific restriction endonuclease McrA